MGNLFWSWEQTLPGWLAHEQLQWFQWIYALWQLIRLNPIIIFALSVLPFGLRQLYHKKTVVIVGNRSDFGCSGDFRDLARVNIEVISDPAIDGYNWRRVKYNGYYYIMHGCALEELSKVIDSWGNDVIFIESILPISDSLSVGKQMSQTEAFEKIFTKKHHCSKATNYAIPVWFDYVEVSTKFWGILSTIPILLQARNYVKFSSLFSLVIIILDINRHWLYKLYDNLFDRITMSVKLHIFKKNTSLYVFFSTFSNRWNYTDQLKKHAYVAQVGKSVKLIYYCKLERSEDLQIRRSYWVPDYSGSKQGQADLETFMGIVKGRAVCELRLNYRYAYPVAILGRPIFVP